MNGRSDVLWTCFGRVVYVIYGVVGSLVSGPGLTEAVFLFIVFVWLGMGLMALEDGVGTPVWQVTGGGSEDVDSFADSSAGLSHGLEFIATCPFLFVCLHIKDLHLPCLFDIACIMT